MAAGIHTVGRGLERWSPEYQQKHTKVLASIRKKHTGKRKREIQDLGEPTQGMSWSLVGTALRDSSGKKKEVRCLIKMTS